MRLQTRDNELNLGNFGVEIETLVKVQPGEVPVEARNRVASALRSAGLDAYAEGYNHSTRNHWKVVFDCSLQKTPSWEGNWAPAEIVSPILNGEDGLQAIERVCNVLESIGVRVNKSCGVHVHHDARHLTEEKIKRIVDLQNRGEDQTDKVLPASRRGDWNRFCRSNKGMDSGISRYLKVNLNSFYRHGTVEFRQHGGTIEAEKIQNWVIYTFLVFSVGTYKTWSDKDFTWATWKRRLGITPGRTEGLVCERIKKLNDWLESRKDHFANA